MVLSKNKKVVLITGSSLRHRYVQNLLIKSKRINLVLVIQEVEKKNYKNNLSKTQKKHFKLRDYYERVFFKKYNKIKFKKNQIISIKPKNLKKNNRIFKLLKKIEPDIILCFGCSVIGEKYIKKFDNKILNIHLGLSPYYRGQATNFWAFVNNELQFIGATFHKIDADIDTGPIIHQIRGRIYKNDNIHLIGNRLIKDLKLDLIKIVLNFENLKSIKKKNNKSKYFRSNDFNDQSINKLYHNYKEKIILKYLKNEKKFFREYTIIENKNL